MRRRVRTGCAEDGVREPMILLRPSRVLLRGTQHVGVVKQRSLLKRGCERSRQLPKRDVTHHQLLAAPSFTEEGTTLASRDA